MKRFFFLLLSLLVSSQAMARCVSPEPKSAYARADAVVLVKLKAVAIEGDVARMETEVRKVWKAKVTDDTNSLTVFSTLEGHPNPYPFIDRVGEMHLLYLTRFSGPPEGFWTGNCVGSWVQSYAQATKHLQWLNRHGRKI